MQRESGKGYDLNVSLFERLVRQGYPCSTLSRQHRMHPDISALIRNTYPNLLDGPKVSSHPEVRGMVGRLAFISHDHREGDENDIFQVDSVSYSNLYEAEMIAKLVSYFLKQGYRNDQIAVLTPYLGQLRLITKKINAEVSREDLGELGDPSVLTSKSKDAVRVATIDNYQGEESDIILISTVRNNAERKMGFLGIGNRVNVLLSRARHGMVILGCESFLRGVSSVEAKALWNDVLNRIGPHRNLPGFPAICATHGTKAIVRTPAEFDTACPDGGCSLPCSTTLPCGHWCPLKCHASNAGHENVKCTILHVKTCAVGHEYSWRCNETAITSCPTCIQIETDRRREEQLKEKARVERANQRTALAQKLAEAQRAVDSEMQRIAQEKDVQEKEAYLAAQQENLKKLQATTVEPRPLPRPAGGPFPPSTSTFSSSSSSSSGFNSGLPAEHPIPTALPIKVQSSNTLSVSSASVLNGSNSGSSSFTDFVEAVRSGDGKKAVAALRGFAASERKNLFERVPQLPSAFLEALGSKSSIENWDQQFTSAINATIEQCLDGRFFEASKVLSSTTTSARAKSTSATCALKSFLLVTEFHMEALDKEPCTLKLVELLAAGHKSNSAPLFILAMINKKATVAAWYALLFLWIELHDKPSVPTRILAEAEAIFQTSSSRMLSDGSDDPNDVEEASPATIWRQIKLSVPLAQQVVSMDELLKLTSIKEVKKEMINVFNQYEVAKSQGQTSKITYHAIFDGNPVPYNSSCT